MSKYAPTIVFCDNQGAISLVKNLTHYTKIKIHRCSTPLYPGSPRKGNNQCGILSNMLADIMTKGLEMTLSRKRSALRIRNVNSKVDTSTIRPNKPNRSYCGKEINPGEVDGYFLPKYQSRQHRLLGIIHLVQTRRFYPSSFHLRESP